MKQLQKFRLLFVLLCVGLSVLSCKDEEDDSVPLTPVNRSDLSGKELLIAKDWFFYRDNFGGRIREIDPPVKFDFRNDSVYVRGEGASSINGKWYLPNDTLMNQIVLDKELWYIGFTSSTTMELEIANSTILYRKMYFN